MTVALVLSDAAAELIAVWSAPGVLKTERCYVKMKIDSNSKQTPSLEFPWALRVSCSRRAAGRLLRRCVLRAEIWVSRHREACHDRDEV